MVHTFACEVEERGEILAIRHLGCFDPEIVEERMAHGLDGTQAGTGCVFEQS